MRENRPCGSEGGEGTTLPDPYRRTDDRSFASVPVLQGTMSSAGTNAGNGAARNGLLLRFTRDTHLLAARMDTVPRRLA
jgi:hypothetical protein